MAVTHSFVPPSGSIFWRDGAASSATLPAAGDVVGQARIAQDTGTIYWWNGSAWAIIGAAISAASVADTSTIDLSVSGGGTLTADLITETVTGTQGANTTTGVGGTGTFGAVTSVSLTAGRWLVWGTVGFNENGATLTTSLTCGISDSATGVGISEFDTNEAPYLTSGANDALLHTPPTIVAPGGTTTYYLNSRFYYTAGTPRHRGRLTAIRIGHT